MIESTTFSGSTGIGENIISVEVTGGTVVFPTPLSLPTGSVDPTYSYTGSI